MKFFSQIIIQMFSLFLFISAPSFALDLDWTGEFRAESHAVFNYSLETTNTTVDLSRLGQGGYYIPGSQNKNITFQTFFLKLKPNVIVNDNVFIKSEWWVGDPIYGIFGSATPYYRDQKSYNSTFSRGSTITAQRLWAELLSEFGTVQIGRAPLHYGLGIVWNEGQGFQDRYASTGDVIRISSKFGSFKLSPAIVKYGIGNSIVGACKDTTNLDGNTGVCKTIGGGHGHGDLTDYSIMFEYENVEEEVTLGLNFIRRVLGLHQDTSGYYVAGNPNGANYTVWDVYAKKKLGMVEVAAEAPVIAGTVGGFRYSTWALATETKLNFSDRFQINLKLGKAPGQPTDVRGLPDSYRALYFHPNYKVGLIMFNYQFKNFVGPNTLNKGTTAETSLVSPFDNPIVNARYANIGGSYRLGKWSFRAGGVIAWANDVAGPGTFYNTWDKKFYTANGGVGTQGDFLGWEMDYGVTYFWDNAFTFDLAWAWFFPGSYYGFTNLPNRSNDVSSVFAIQAMGGIRF